MLPRSIWSMLGTFMKTIRWKSKMENTVKHHIYLDTFVMGSIYVIKYLILVKNPEIQIPSSWPHVQACIYRLGEWR